MIGNEKIFGTNLGKQVMPTKHQQVVCTYHQADEGHAKLAIKAAAKVSFLKCCWN